MRIFQAILGLLVSGAVVTACTINQNDCEKNPELACYSHGAGGGGTTSTGAGGTGGGTCMSETQCPIPADKCKERVCESGACGARDRDCGMLTCSSTTGLCEGCDDNAPMKKCPDKDCNNVACVDKICIETPNGALPCGEGTGTCDDAGNCGLCTDGIKNGDETGIDCGPFTCGSCNGEMCEAGTNCHSEFCVDGVCCDVACDGLCQACDLGGMKGTCSSIPVGTPDMSGNGCSMDVGGCGVTAGYCRCDDGVKNGDETDVDCGGPTCGQKCGTGHLATKKEDCISDKFADGYCCNSDCNGACEACNLPGREGLCSVLDAGTADAPQCTGTQVCGVDGGCNKPAGEGCGQPGQCASNKCVGGLCVVCDGVNTCTATQVCVNGACYDKAENGLPCVSDAGCSDSGAGNNPYCVDGVCCNVPCEGLCMACHLNYTAKPTGTCAPILPGYDPHKECPLPDPAQPGPGGSAYCSGDENNGNSSCAQP